MFPSAVMAMHAPATSREWNEADGMRMRRARGRIRAWKIPSAVTRRDRGCSSDPARWCARAVRARCRSGWILHECGDGQVGRLERGGRWREGQRGDQRRRQAECGRQRGSLVARRGGRMMRARTWPGRVGCTEGSRFRTRPARRQRPAWPALFREDRCRWRARTPSGPARHAGSRGRATCRPRQCALSPGPRRLAAVGTDMCDRSSCRWRYRRIGAGCPSWPRPIVTTRWDASARFAR